MKKFLLMLFIFGSAALSYGEEASTEAPESTPSPVESFVFKSDNIPSYEATFMKMLITLGGLLALVFFTIWLLKKASHGRLGNLGTQKKITILEKKPLSPKTLLYLVELDGKKILISESQLEVRTISHPVEEDIYE